MSSLRSVKQTTNAPQPSARRLTADDRARQADPRTRGMSYTAGGASATTHRTAERASRGKGFAAEAAGRDTEAAGVDAPAFGSQPLSSHKPEGERPSTSAADPAHPHDPSAADAYSSAAERAGITSPQTPTSSKPEPPTVEERGLAGPRSRAPLRGNM